MALARKLLMVGGCVWCVDLVAAVAVAHCYCCRSSVHACGAALTFPSASSSSPRLARSATVMVVLARGAQRRKQRMDVLVPAGDLGLEQLPLCTLKNALCASPEPQSAHRS